MQVFTAHVVAAAKRKSLVIKIVITAQGMWVGRFISCIFYLKPRNNRNAIKTAKHRRAEKVFMHKK